MNIINFQTALITQVSLIITEGQWRNGKREGQGTQIWPDGAKYEGEWKNGKACGKGKFWHVDGDVFEGEWENDKANGYGVYTHKDGAQYKGYWKDDCQHGKGIETWADGSRYEGEYKLGKKDGEGDYVWADGSQYKGTWVDNNIEGKVIFLKNHRGYTNGMMEECMKENGKTTICMDMEFIVGLMGENTKVNLDIKCKGNIIRIKNKDMEYIIGVMEEDLMECGRMEYNMVKECFMMLMVLERKDYGRMVND